MIQLLENIIDPLMTEEVKNQIDAEVNQIRDEQQLFFQQGGAPSHYAANVRTKLT